MNTSTFVIIVIIIILCMVSSLIALAVGDNIPGVGEELRRNPQNRTWFNWGSGTSIALCSCLLLIFFIVFIVQMMRKPGVDTGSAVVFDLGK